MLVIEQEKLTEVLTRVLETMAFAVRSPDVDRDGAPSEKTMRVCAVIKFTGEFNGKVMLTVPAEMLPDLVKDMLGEDEDALYSSKQMCDALSELANVMCGNLLAEIVGTETVFDLEQTEVNLHTDPEVLLAGDTVLGSSRVALKAGWAELAVALDATS